MQIVVPDIADDEFTDEMAARPFPERAPLDQGVASREAVPYDAGVALGGPGSGWHAEQGHVPGSQGGTGKKPQGGPKAKATGPVTKEHVAL